MNGWLLVSAATAAAAVVLLVPGAAVTKPARWRASPGWMLGAVAIVLALLASLPARVTALAVIGAGCAAGTQLMLRRRRRRREIASGQARVLDFCQLIAAELLAGQAPGTALERGAEEWPQLGPVAKAFRLGGDVPAALRSAAKEPGHQDLALAAAAWQVAHHSGSGLSAAVSRVASGLRATQATRRVVNAELASARATARLMAGLPVLALLMGSGIGGDPVSFLIGSPGGLGCLAGGLALGFAGLWWIEAIADDVAAGVA